ncbi:LicD family protein [Mycoplasmopsis caviae]|uniref:LPS biosynthesis protein n=1 Tax=Mycoplasmopsis caviae TaxID=55603 RepID=A0A3P8KWE7_9BACT|nr:LicD family protein [Mycoplasmopsis caviae]UUD35519.1 LicD family protein [Mycoplasmopsis caviae]VDR41707.1 LPS biosynthesis protein [Mycoplasmopsis caviae]
MNNENILNSQQLKQKEQTLELFWEFKELCDKHNLKYSIAYGTALGAVRENKMIPWDTDIDVFITKETYDFLLKEYPEKFLNNNKRWYMLTFPRFVKSQEDIVIKNQYPVYLDLFILQKSSYKRIKKYNSSFFNKLRCLKSIGWVSYHFRNVFWTWVAKIFIFLFLFWVPKLTIKSSLKQLAAKKNEWQVVYVANCWPLSNPNYYMNSVVPIDDFDNLCEIEFENKRVKIIRNVENHLITTYGSDWRIPKVTKHAIYYGYFEMSNK